MKFPLDFVCSSCKQSQQVFITLTEKSKLICKNCGSVESLSFGTDVTVGDKLMQRALYEINTAKDYSLTIVIAAAAVDSELSHLYKKWAEIEELDKSWPSPQFYDAVEAKVRNLRQISKKIEETTKMMVSLPLDEYVAGKEDLRRIVEQGFPSLKDGIMKGAEEYLFWKRNDVLHTGDVEVEEATAIRAINIARFLLLVLKEADKERRTKIE